MNSQALSIESYVFSQTDAFLVDANVWLSVYGPQADPADRRTWLYSGALAKIFTTQCTIYLDVLILSEFVNRYCRLEFELQKTNGTRDFKEFRKSPAFRSVAEAVADNIRRILKRSQRIGSDLESLDIASLLERFERESSDFNDLVLAELCKRRGLKLITHDADFKGLGLTILTANEHLLS